MDFPIEIQSEFEYIVRAFQFVASMFSASSGYTGFIATLGVLGIFFGGMSAISAQAMSGRAAIQGWFMNMLVASVVIVMLLGSKSTVIIHDTVSNQMRSVGGIPTVMATLAYMENRVENGVKDIITTVMSPIIPYEDIGKGEGFELLASLDKAANTYITKYPYVMRSMESYFEDCGLKDLARGWISEDAIYKSADMWADLKSETETNFTVVYDTAQGTTYSCRAAWNKINDMLAVAQVRSAVEAQCKEKYRDPNAVNKCLQNQDDITAGFLAGGAFTSIDLNSVIRSYLVSYAMHSSNGTLAVMLNDVNKKNAANAFMAEKMLPRLKGMMYGMMIGIFPLLVGFVWFNPAKTIVFYAGMFIMLVLWSAIDTFMDMQYQNEVYQMFATMRDMGLGVKQMFDIPNKAADAVALYGSGRWLALGLATAISGAITGVSSYAISQMGSQLGASAQSAANAGAGYMDSAGKTNIDRQAAADFGSRELSSMMSVPNWNSYGTGQAMDTKAASVKNSMLTQDTSMEMVANSMGQAGAVNTSESMSAAQAKMDYFNSSLPKVGDLAYKNSTISTSSSDAYLSGMAALNGGGLKEIGKNIGDNRALTESAQMANTNAQRNAVGDKRIIDNASKRGTFDAGKETGFFENMEKYSGNLLSSGMKAGTFDTQSLLRGQADMTGRIEGSGGNFRNYLADTHALGEYGQQSDLGNMDAVKTQAALMNMGVEQYSEFMRNGNIIDSKTATYLNDKFATDVFKEGQQFRFSVGEKGFTEMSVTDNVKGKQLGSYTLDGTQSTILNDDGSAASNRYDGIFSKDGKQFAGGITTGQGDNIITASGSTGSELYDKLIDTQTTQLGSQYSGVLHNILSGKKDAFARLEGLSGDELEAEERLLAGSIASEINNMFRLDQENQQWGTSAGANLDGRADLHFKSGEQLAGWLAEKASGLSLDYSVGINGRLGIDRQDKSYSQQNINAAEIYNIIHHADGNVDIMADNVKAYSQDKIGENLSGMGVAADAIKEGWSKFEQIGGTVGITIGKNSETGKPMAEVIKSWEKK